MKNCQVQRELRHSLRHPVVGFIQLLSWNNYSHLAFSRLLSILYAPNSTILKAQV